MRISYSALETFIICPAKYKYQCLDKIKTPKSKEAVFGTLIHECLKIFHNPSQLVPLLEDELLKYFTDKWNSEIYTDKQEEAFAFHQGVEMLKNYYTNNQQNQDFKIIDLETSFAIPFTSGDDIHQITGRIDRIDKLADGSFEIVDYKTAKKMPAQKEIDNNLQLSIYYLGFLHRWPSLQNENKSVKLSLYFLRHGEKLSTSRNYQKINEDKEKILSLINQIQQSSFEPKSNALCAWCQYQPYCPLFRHKFISQQTAAPDEQKIKLIIQEYFEIKERQAGDTKKIAELKKSINLYCDENKLERVFSDERYITRLSQRRFGYDMEKVRAVLEPLGKWDEILTVNSAKLNKVIKILPPYIKKEIESAKFVEKEFKILTTSR